MHKPLVVDSSVLIALDSRGRLGDYLRQRKDEGYEIIIPEAVMKEVVEEPSRIAEEIRERSSVLADKMRASAIRINSAIDEGLIKVETVDYRKHSKTMDNIRKHIGKLEAKPEHLIKKGDTEIIALIIQLCYENKEKVYLATFDKGLLKALKPFSKEVEYEVLGTF
jgi:rRNA-processing protein FCF1